MTDQPNLKVPAKDTRPAFPIEENPFALGISSYRDAQHHAYAAGFAAGRAALPDPPTARDIAQAFKDGDHQRGIVLASEAKAAALPDERLREAVIAEVVRWLREKADGTGTAQNAWAAGFAAEIIEGELAAADREAHLEPAPQNDATRASAALAAGMKAAAAASPDERLREAVAALPQYVITIQDREGYTYERGCAGQPMNYTGVLLADVEALIGELKDGAPVTRETTDELKDALREIASFDACGDARSDYRDVIRVKEIAAAALAAADRDKPDGCRAPHCWSEYGTPCGTCPAEKPETP